MTVYELGYLLIPLVREDEIPGTVAALKETLSAHNATVFAEEAPALLELAYEMDKVLENKNKHFNTGYFGWMKFEAPSTDLPALKKKLDESNVLLRYILLKTVKENTVFSKKPLSETLKITEKDEVVVEDDIVLDTDIEDPAIAAIEVLEEVLPEEKPEA